MAHIMADIMHTETVDILLRPPTHYFSLSLYPLLFFVQRQQICPPCHFGRPGARNHGFSSLRPIWTAIQAGQLCLWWVDDKSRCHCSPWTNCAYVQYVCVSAAAVIACKAALSFTWEHCTALYIPSSKLLQPFSDVPGVWCIVHVQLCQTETALAVTQRKRNLLGDDAAVLITSEDTGADILHHRMTLHFSIPENTQTVLKLYDNRYVVHSKPKSYSLPGIPFTMSRT